MLGPKGDWVESIAHQVSGKQSDTFDVDSFEIARLPDGTRRFVWALENAPPNLAGFRIRYLAGSGHEWGDMQPLHGGLLTSSPWETNQLAAGIYTFGIKAEDRSGNRSTSARIIEATIGDPRLQNVLLARDEGALGWPGTLSGCFRAYGGHLEALPSSGNWSTLGATWSSLAASWGGPRAQYRDDHLHHAADRYWLPGELHAEPDL